MGYLFNKIDRYGAFAGSIIAVTVWIGTGAAGILSLFLFFIIGTTASSWKKDVKSQDHLAQENEGKRSTSNVMANGGVAFVISVVAILVPHLREWCMLMVVASFATACSDTLSSELGNVYGKKYYNILTLKTDIRGLDGVISVSGLLFGLAGSFAIASCVLLFRNHYVMFVIIATSGFFGNLVDSILGATLQQKGHLNNHSVNFFATMSGAIFAISLYLILI